jgi:hypothetical protein
LHQLEIIFLQIPIKKSWTHHLRGLRDDVSNLFLGEKDEKTANGKVKFNHVGRRLQQVFRQLSRA